LCWFGIFGLGSDCEVDANSRLEFGILIDSRSDLKFEMICQLWSFIWAGLFCRIEFSLLVPETSLMS
jgi:hypothetical protein